MSYNKIVVGIDGSNTASKAMKEAAELSKLVDGSLLVVSAYEPPDPHELTRWQSESPADMSWRFTGTAVVEEVLERAQRQLESQEGVKSQALFREGEAADALISVAEDEKADLIVVGNKGMAGAQRFLLGSVPNKVTHHAPCDVLIVKTT